jgi:hypothetical protein
VIGGLGAERADEEPLSSWWLEWEFWRLKNAMGRAVPRNQISIHGAADRIEALLARYGGDDERRAMRELRADPDLMVLLDEVTKLPGAYLYGHDQALGPAVDAVRQRPPYPFLVREFPTQEFNASVVNTVSGFLILIDSGTPFFINNCAKVLGYACPELVPLPGDVTYEPESGGADGTEILQGGVLLAVCALTLSTHVREYLGGTGASLLSSLPHAQPAKFKILTEIIGAAERFMIAHEHGHIAFDHLTLDLTAEHIASRPRDDELQADRFAADVLIRPEPNAVGPTGFARTGLPMHVYTEAVIAGIALFLGASRLIEAARDAAPDETETENTHPSAGDRWEAIASYVAPRYPEQMACGEAVYALFDNFAPGVGSFAVHTDDEDDSK